TSSGGTDPARGNTAVGSFSRINGGNPNLQPEESRSLSFGLIFTPQLLPGLRLITDYVKIKKEHNIANAPSVATLVTYFPERITRGAKLPTDAPDWEGPITFVDQTLINMARAEIEAYDVQLDYRLNTTSRGAFEVYALA